MSRNTLRLVIQKWWFFLFPLCLFCIPPYTSNGYALMELGHVNAFILTHTIKNYFHLFYPIFKIIPICLVFSIITFGEKASRIFSLYIAITYFLFAILQSISFTETYGLGICLAHLMLSLLLAVFWLGEVKSPRNDFSPRGRSLWKYWVVIPALFAFWEPANPVTGMPDFNLKYLVTSGGGLAFCIMTPVYLALLTIHYPNINLPILKITSFIGILYGLGNIVLVFYLGMSGAFWIGVLHVPLLMISIYGLALSSRNLPNRTEVIQI